jgi:hypothetical protein
MYAGLSIADEKVSGTCRRRTRVVDVQTCVHDVIIPESLPRKVTTVLLMVDHGTTHAPTHLLRQHEGVLRFQVRWVPPNASWLDQIDSWFSMLQRTYVPPTHVVSPTT